MQSLVRSLAFRALASPETNDHEVRIVIDGEDIIDRLSPAIGLDPIDFFEQHALLQGGRAVIARCDCGVRGCGDWTAKITVGDTFVEWNADVIGTLRFPSDAYRRWTVGAANDRGWEDANRRAERLVSEVLAGMHLDDGKVFQWASARIAPGQIKLSFWGDGEQSFLSIDWDAVRVDTAVAAAMSFRHERGR
ncbi:hypothetical protein [Burkholderia pyrrocinia]|uniref:hypothetical protein n=1 Tax=Burkholderia pyrrocinia TaxID=60550 RepID=UPI001BCBF29E|nr:hypothetical protein [Burkholderia pyrrocinia]QVN18586.1 hypothetical protein JYG32_02285 [Burkholderia pyrrocinia]